MFGEARSELMAKSHMFTWKGRMAFGYSVNLTLQRHMRFCHSPRYNVCGFGARVMKSGRHMRFSAVALALAFRISVFSASARRQRLRSRRSVLPPARHPSYTAMASARRQRVRGRRQSLPSRLVPLRHFDRIFRGVC